MMAAVAAVSVVGVVVKTDAVMLDGCDGSGGGAATDDRGNAVADAHAADAIVDASAAAAGRADFFL